VIGQSDSGYIPVATLKEIGIVSFLIAARRPDHLAPCRTSLAFLDSFFLVQPEQRLNPVKL
jgi:hypothetical protein